MEALEESVLIFSLMKQFGFLQVQDLGVMDLHQLNCTDNVLHELPNIFFNKNRFCNQKSVILGYCKMTTEELTFNSTVLKSALICWFIYILWGKEKECKKGNGYFFLF